MPNSLKGDFMSSKSIYQLIPFVFGLLLGQNAFSETAKAATPTPTAATEKAAPATANKKTCDDLKTEIDTKIKAKGVKTFSLDIVSKADVKDAKIVGSCEGGSKKITYKKG